MSARLVTIPSQFGCHFDDNAVRSWNMARACAYAAIWSRPGRLAKAKMAPRWPSELLRRRAGRGVEEGAPEQVRGQMC